MPNLSNKTSFVLEKSSSEKVLDWVKFWVKSLFFLIFIMMIFNSAELSSEIWSSIWSIQTKYVWKYWETVVKKPEKPEIAWIKVSWIIANKWFWVVSWVSASENIMLMLDLASKNDKVKLIVLEIDSPWWTVLDSEKIANKINEVKRYKKVYALLESVAASWGYYVASQCDKIFAYDETITWSIWVIISIPNVSKLAEKIWIDKINISSWKFKTMWDPLSPFDNKSKEIFQELVDESYEKFVKIVSLWRNIPEKQVRWYADWRIYSWIQAEKLNLIDSLWWKDKLLKELDQIAPDFNTLLFNISKSPFEELFIPMWKALKSFIWINSGDLNIQSMYLLN